MLVSTLTAQPCYRGISTDPDAPVNPQCPTLVNTFDWRTEMLPVSGNPLGLPITEIRSPFWEDESPSMSFLAEPFYTTYYDFQVEEGWEILFADMEYRPDKNYVYFVLYNKYESLIRVFTTQAQITLPTFATAMQAKFSGEGISALLSPFKGRNQALEEASLGKVEMTNFYYNNSFRFTYFDIPVEYDPCTCQDSNASLSINFAFLDEQQLALYRRYTNVQEPLATVVNLGFGNRLAPDDFLAGTDGEISGVSIFKTWNQLIAYHRSLSIQVTELKKEYNRIQAFDKVLKLALQTEGGQILSSLKLTKTTLTIGEEEVTIMGKDAAELFLSSLNLWGAGVKKRLNSAQSQIALLGSSPMSLGEYISRGSLVPLGEYSSGGPEFALPGSATDCTDPDNYPLYNEVLGRMAMLRKPKVSMQPIGAQLPGNPLLAAQFSVDASSIQYVFNPAAEINESATEINAMLRIYNLSNQSSGSPNLTQINDDPIGFVSPLLPLGCIADYVAQLDFPFEPPPAQLPLDLQVDLILFVAYTFDNGYQALQQYTYPVSLEVQPVQYESTANQPAVGFTPNYPTDLVLSATNYQEDELVFAYRQISIEGDQRLANFSFQTEVVLTDGTIIPASTTSLGDIFVEIVAPEVLVKDGVTLLANPPEGSGGEIWLHSKVYFRDCDPIPPSNADLVAFCSSNDYRANTSQPLRDTEETSTVPLPTASELKGNDGLPLGISVSPNPVGDYASIVLELPEDESVTISIIDITGRTVEVLIQGQSLLAGKHYFDLPGQRLSSGNYVLRVQTREGTAVCRFVR
jgi:hypothetical protein